METQHLKQIFVAEADSCVPQALCLPFLTLAPLRLLRHPKDQRKKIIDLKDEINMPQAGMQGFHNLVYNSRYSLLHKNHPKLNGIKQPLLPYAHGTCGSEIKTAEQECHMSATLDVWSLNWESSNVCGWNLLEACSPTCLVPGLG